MPAWDVATDGELLQLCEIARAAAELVRAEYARHARGETSVEMKGPGDPVTVADRAANELICERLFSQFPGEAVIAEESAPRTGEALAALIRHERVFFVDPLDGTWEFVRRAGEFAVMIGLAVAGRAELGVVALPVEGTIYAARVSSGAFALPGSGSSPVPLQVSPCTAFSEATMLMSRSHTPAIVQPLCRRLGVAELRPCGSVGVKATRIASGQADLYVHAGLGMKLWDTCAPEAVLRAAGGRLTDLDGSDIDYATVELALRRGLVASNGALHAGVLSAVLWAEREALRLG